jgi:hypothetical protein
MHTYHVCPQWPIGSMMSVDFAIAFTIEYRPLLLLEIKAPSHFQWNSDRAAAIKQVTERLDEVGPNNVHADRLYAISVIGKRWRACYALRGRTSHHGRSVRGITAINSLRSANPGCWNLDITSDNSWAALQRIVETIHGYVNQ